MRLKVEFSVHDIGLGLGCGVQGFKVRGFDREGGEKLRRRSSGCLRRNCANRNKPLSKLMRCVFPHRMVSMNWKVIQVIDMDALACNI